MTKVIKGVGGFSHKEWRAFSNDRKTCDASHVRANEASSPDLT